MSDVLARICADTRRAIDRAKVERPLAALERDAAAAPAPRGFIDALDHAVAVSGYGLIAEIKRASPSRGLIRRDFTPAALARAYERGGAACLSVLTDAPYFHGEPAHLVEARHAVTLPVLRKDFILDPYQVVEARVMGADCILLIMAVLTEDEARALEATATRWGMDVLAEVHDHAELLQALRLQTRLIGINNRNLKTLSVDLAVTEGLVSALPEDRVAVSESGLHASTDLARMARVGVRRFLVGESLMRQHDVEEATRTLLAPVGAAHV